MRPSGRDSGSDALLGFLQDDGHLAVLDYLLLPRIVMVDEDSGSHARALHTWRLRASPTPPAGGFDHTAGVSSIWSTHGNRDYVSRFPTRRAGPRDPPLNRLACL